MHKLMRQAAGTVKAALQEHQTYYAFNDWAVTASRPQAEGNGHAVTFTIRQKRNAAEIMEPEVLQTHKWRIAEIVGEKVSAHLGKSGFSLGKISSDLKTGSKSLVYVVRLEPVKPQNGSQTS